MAAGVGAIDEGPDALVWVLPEAGEEAGILSGNERGSVGTGEEVVVAALDGEHGTEDGSVTGAPGEVGTEHVFPDEDASSIHPGGMEFAGVVGIPAVDEMELVPGFEPFVAEDTWGVGVGQPLGPREVVGGDVLYGQGEFTFEDCAWLGGLELPGEIVGTVGHGIQEDPVGIECLQQ